MKRIIKLCFILPLYLFLLFEGFLGGFGTTKSTDIWDELAKWSKR